MKHHYKDITDKLGQPQWWDEHGCPRYCEAGPQHGANIYADHVALVEIACQSCGTTFPVLFSEMSHWGRDLVEAVKDHRIHYGDPPNYECCAAGPTMNSEPKRVIKFWIRNQKTYSWEEAPELCIRLDEPGEKP